ncbi:MAG: NERD domain-containing protein [Phycisphaeraceae bacterium]|nr:NERD domain-containing protein [Phycisphaeraceae bacterium]
MISKPFDELPTLPNDLRRKAGYVAEKQLAFYLHRDFATDAEVRVLNGLRLVDPDQPEHHGGDGVAQIDHLVLHRWGAFIIESKSVSEVITVRGDGSGGDVWTRRYKGRDEGVPSPVKQAERQGQFLRNYLQTRREQLLGQVAFGMRTLSKLINKTDQRGFLNMPIQIVVAISDTGVLERSKGWREPSEPFQTYVCKADCVADKVREEIGKHRAAAPLVAVMNGKYGIWRMLEEELEGVAQFLAARDTPLDRSVEGAVDRAVDRTGGKSASGASAGGGARLRGELRGEMCGPARVRGSAARALVRERVLVLVLARELVRARGARVVRRRPRLPASSARGRT